MGATASLSQAGLVADAGGEVAIDVQVKNTGTVVDEFTVEVLGPTKPWATPVPPTLSLFPEASGTVKVTFRPPRSPSTRAGIAAFGIMVHSREDPTRTTVEEGELQITPYLEPSAELVPRTSRGSRTGNHELAIDNRGNVPFDADLAGEDPDRLVAFEFDPPAVSVDPGTAGFAKVRVKPVQPFWRGPAKTRSFQIAVKPRAETAAPIAVAGTMLQESILPPWFLRALIAAIVILVALLLLWLFVLQPQIKSSAEQVLVDFGFTPVPSSQRSGAPSAGATAAATPAPTTAPTAAASTEPSASVEPSPSAAGTTVPVTAAPSGTAGPSGATAEPTKPAIVTPKPTPQIITAPPQTAQPTKAVVQVPISGRLDSKTVGFTAAGNTQVFITDLVFSNPTGASGTIVLQVNGKTLLSLKLDNYRDLDFHFVTPIVVDEGQTMRIVPGCAGTCDPALLFSGYIQAK